MSDLTLNSIAAIASSTTAIVAVIIAILAEWRSREAEKRGAELLTAEIYVTLRTGFIDIFEKLGDLGQGSASTLQERLAREAYWHHAYDEWFISRRLAPHALPELWDVFRDKVRSGGAHPALAQSLSELMKDPEAGFGAYAGDFIEELER
jgi:hypothetical protein